MPICRHYHGRPGFGSRLSSLHDTHNTPFTHTARRQCHRPRRYHGMAIPSTSRRHDDRAPPYLTATLSRRFQDYTIICRRLVGAIIIRIFSTALQLVASRLSSRRHRRLLSYRCRRSRLTVSILGTYRPLELSGHYWRAFIIMVIISPPRYAIGGCRVACTAALISLMAHDVQELRAHYHIGTGGLSSSSDSVTARLLMASGDHVGGRVRYVGGEDISRSAPLRRSDFESASPSPATTTHYCSPRRQDVVSGRHGVGHTRAQVPSSAALQMAVKYIISRNTVVTLVAKSYLTALSFI